MSADRPGTNRWRDGLDLVATIAVIALCLSVCWVIVVPRLFANSTPTKVTRSAVRPPPPPLPAAPVDIAGATTRGNRTAKVAVLAYSEFKCPYCGVFARDTLPGLLKTYIDTGRVLLAFRHFPLDALHPFARQAAQAADCAGQQGKFWELHDKMFANQAQLDAIELATFVKTTGVDTTRFSACMAADSARRVQDDATSGQALGVTGTPTFFIGLVQADGRVLLKQRLTGAQPLPQFEAALARWLAEVGDRTK